MKERKSINRRLKDWVDREMAEMFKSNQPPEKDPRQMTYFATPSSLYSRPVSEWTEAELAAEIMLLQMKQDNQPEVRMRQMRQYPTIPIGVAAPWMSEFEASPECNVWGVPFPEKSFTPYLAGAGGPKPSGMKPQASPSASPSGHPAPLATTGRPEDYSSLTSSPGSVTPEKTPNNGPTLSLTGESRSQPTTTTSGEAISRGNSGRVSPEKLCDCGHLGGAGGSHWTYGGLGPKPCHAPKCACLRYRRMKFCNDCGDGLEPSGYCENCNKPVMVCAGPGKWLCGVGFGHVCGGQS